VCDTLSLKVVDDAATRLVARTIIDLTQRGVRDAATLGRRNGGGEIANGNRPLNASHGIEMSCVTLIWALNYRDNL